MEEGERTQEKQNKRSLYKHIEDKKHNENCLMNDLKLCYGCLKNMK